MRYCFGQHGARSLSIALMLFSIGSASFLSAQNSGPGGISSIRPSGPFGDSIEARNRETALRSLKVDAAQRGQSGSVPPAVLERLNNDLKQIQIVRAGLVRDIRDAKVFEYERLVRETAEIRS